jgi:HPt (histidine-containing phosphotransfer) domain-containing protein
MAVNNNKLDDVMQLVHKLKGSSKYVGAARLAEVCHLIQVAHINRLPNVIVAYY